MNKDNLPFGILFEERIQTSQESISPEYDSFESMSFFINSQGLRVIFVSESWGEVGTQTFTEIRREDTDTDVSEDS